MSERQRVVESLRLRNCPTCDCLILISVENTVPDPVHRECIECGTDLRSEDIGLGIAT